MNTFIHAFVWFFLTFLCVCPTTAQVEHDFSMIDGYVDKAPDIDQGDLKTISEYLVATSKNDFEKARAIYRWIITNISYDDTAYKNGERRINRSSEDILKRQQAVCLGYANLFQEMAQQVGLETVVISGYTRNQSSGAFDLEEVSHVWNAVHIENRWYLLDATWDSGLLGKTSKFVQKYKRDYFLTEPKYFLLEHLPANPIWQLIDCPITVEQAQFSEEDLLERSLDTCSYDVNAIVAFMQLNTEERRLEEAKATYQFHPSINNKKYLGNAYIDYHNYLDEKLFSFQEANELDSIISIQETMMDCCEKAAELTTLLDKQQENCAYNYLNHAIALRNSNKSYSKELILDNLAKAKTILEGLPSNFLIQQGLKRCEQVMKYIQP